MFLAVTFFYSLSVSAQGDVGIAPTVFSWVFTKAAPQKNFPESETNSDRPVSIYMKPHRAYA
jgi:hypothetical protein